MHVEKVHSCFRILLDKKPIVLPGKTILEVDTLKMANCIAQEWRNVAKTKGDVVSYQKLPMTRIVGTMIEKISPKRDIYINALIPYFNSDCLCYFSDNSAQLLARQKEAWLPAIKLFENKFGFSVKTTLGVMPIIQDFEGIKQIKNYLMNLSDAKLTAMTLLVPSLGSFILSILIVERVYSPSEAYTIAFFDELYQSKVWGQDREQEKKHTEIKTDIEDAYSFLSILC